MPKEIWNQGRVVGYSAYEVYVKQHLQEDPSTPPATEREWLASSISLGSSMIYRMPDVIQGEDDCTYIDVFLPKNSRLAAANTLVASFFEGDADFGDDNWATKVVDYSMAISNTSSRSPSGTLDATGSIPAQSITSWSLDKKNKLADYMRIFDGVVIQPGTWYESDSKPPEKDFSANLKSPYPRIRLLIKGSIKNHPLILFSGFTIRTVLAGVVGQDTCLDTQSPQDGDFLGPAVFPWAAKIVFSVPTSYITFFESGGYRRTIETPTSKGSKATKNIKDSPVIDMQASKPETFYDSYDSYKAAFSPNTDNPRYLYNVNDFSTLGEIPTDGGSVLTVYQKSEVYPPALYGTFVSSKGDHYLNPLDIVAPGSVKMFYNQTGPEMMKDYQDTFPGTTAVNKTPEGVLQILNVNNQLVDVAGLEEFYATNSGQNFQPVSGTNLSGDSRPKLLKIKTGQKSVLALMMSSNISNGYGVDPTQLTLSPNPTSSISLNRTNSSNNISWAALVSALKNNQSIDILGNRLKSAKETLVRNRDTSGPYLEFGPDSSPLRLYITDSVPDASNVPVGSIGIGWGFTPKG